MEIRRVAHGSPEYRSLVELRRTVLMHPIGLDLSDAQLRAESSDLFLAALDDGELVASLVLTPRGPGEVQMRQVAVATDHQGQGIGAAIVRESEKVAVEEGFQLLIVSARMAAVPFYERLGYRVVGEEYAEVGIPHRRLEKVLTDRFRL